MKPVNFSWPDMLGEGTYSKVIIIGNSWIEKGAVIGDRTIIYPGCYIFADVTIGWDCIIKPNTAIGGKGFIYPRNVNDIPMPVVWSGSVIIDDEVHIGSAVSIDRGQDGITSIGTHTKIDNLCQIAHDVKIGEKVIIAAGAIIGGHAVIGDYARIGLQNTIRNRVSIGAHAQTGMHTSVTRDVPDGWGVSGWPAKKTELPPEPTND